MTWIPCSVQQPKDNVVVRTCIMDDKGFRNEANLIRHGNLWFTEDMSMYVYYVPTHWKEANDR